MPHRDLNAPVKFLGIRKTIPHRVTAFVGALLVISSFLSTTVLKSQTSSSSPEALQILSARATQAQGHGDYRAAARIYEEMLKESPDSAELSADLGLMHHLLGEYSEAIRDFHTALQEQPRLFVPNLFIGLDLVQTGQPREAVSYLETAHKLRPNDPNAVLGLGGAYKGSGDLLEARKFYEEAVELSPQNPRAWLGLGLTYSELEERGVDRIERDHPASEYREALEAESLAGEGRLNDALERYRHLTQTVTVETCFGADYGLALLRSGRPQDAEEEFGKELASAPRCMMDRLGLASIAAERGDAATALGELSDIWRTDPNFLSANMPVVWENLTAAEVESLSEALKGAPSDTTSGGAPSEFRQVALLSLERWRKEPIATFAVKEINFLGASGPALGMAHQKPDEAGARRFYAEAKYTACRNTLQSGISELSDQGCVLLAQCGFASGDFRTAFRASQRAVDQDAGDASAWYWRTRASQVLALNALAQAGAAGPYSPSIHVMLGDVYLNRRMFAKAEAEYRKAIGADPRNVAAHLGVAAALYRLFLLDKALPELKLVLQLDPRNPQANFMMGDILAYHRKFAQAEPYAKAALRGDPSNLPLAHALLARIYAHQGLTDQAIVELEQSLPVDHDGSLHYQIAMLYKQIGDMRASRAALRESEALRKQHDTGTPNMRGLP